MTICLGISALALRHAGPTEALLLLLQAGLIVIIITILEWSGRQKR
jgi:hypothetical protein